MADYNMKSELIRAIIQKNTGNNEVYIYIEDEKLQKKLGNENNISMNEDIIKALEELIGQDNVKIVERVLNIW